MKVITAFKELSCYKHDKCLNILSLVKHILAKSLIDGGNFSHKHDEKQYHYV